MFCWLFGLLFWGTFSSVLLTFCKSSLGCLLLLLDLLFNPWLLSPLLSFLSLKSNLVRFWFTCWGLRSFRFWLGGLLWFLHNVRWRYRLEITYPFVLEFSRIFILTSSKFSSGSSSTSDSWLWVGTKGSGFLPRFNVLNLWIVVCQSSFTFMA